ncbi:hypothetical protein CFC21_048443 [Triticum aestivum]|uniref:Uncharacterized protein n=2 Tax=Triticum aestivum TaxID=4565 RepID=A0A9R1G188_WHEAT|nr:hypothetical protein CFC21_048443 [Triticum aestivum]
MKFRVVCRKVYDYVRYDLKEIAFPSSLPDPPGTKRPTRLYGASWVRDIGPEIRPNDYKKAKEEYEPNSAEGETKSGPTVLEDLAPVLWRIYMTRASTYTSAVKNYVETYQEGLKDVLDEKATGKGHQQGNEPRRSSALPPHPQSSS